MCSYIDSHKFSRVVYGNTKFKSRPYKIIKTTNAHRLRNAGFQIVILESSNTPISNSLCR